MQYRRVLIKDLMHDGVHISKYSTTPFTAAVPSPWEGFGGLSSPKRTSKPPKMKCEVYNVKPSPAQMQRPPIENFLTTVLYWSLAERLRNH